jgi:16S rRNA C1402 N4-methylase RsmH
MLMYRRIHKLKCDHIPVLLKETMEILRPSSHEIYVDATLGAGGYTRSILRSNDREEDI